MSLTLAGVERAYELVKVSTADESDEVDGRSPAALLDDEAAAVFLSSLSDLPEMRR